MGLAMAVKADDVGENTLQPRFTNNKFLRKLLSCDRGKKRERNPSDRPFITIGFIG